MKHLEYKLWAEISKTKEHELAWHDALVKMEEDYDLAKKKLNKKFVKIYEEENRFHDASVRNYKMHSVKKFNKYVLNIEIETFSFDENSYRLTYKGVDSCKYNHHTDTLSDKYCLNLEDSIGEWMYSEIYLEDKHIVMNIALAGYGEINIKCKDIKIEEL